MELDAWLVPFRRFWSKHVDALERHLDRMDKAPTKVPSVKKERRDHDQPRTIRTGRRFWRRGAKRRREVDARSRPRPLPTLLPRSRNALTDPEQLREWAPFDSWTGRTSAPWVMQSSRPWGRRSRLSRRPR